MSTSIDQTDILLIMITMKAVSRVRRNLKQLGVDDETLDKVGQRAGWTKAVDKLVVYDYSGYLFLINQVDTDYPMVFFRRDSERALLPYNDIPEYMVKIVIKHLDNLRQQYSNLEKVYGSLTWMTPAPSEPTVDKGDRLNELTDASRSVLSIVKDRVLEFIKG